MYLVVVIVDLYILGLLFSALASKYPKLFCSVLFLMEIRRWYLWSFFNFKLEEANKRELCSNFT